MSSAAFPRGGLKSEEAKDPKQEKKEKRKRKENDADLLATRKPAKRVDKAPAAEPEQHQQSTPLDVLTTTTIVKAARGKPAKLRPVRFASYHAETTVLGVVRSTSTKHALVSLPGNLVGHVDVSGALQLTPNTVVRCAVLSTSRAGAAPGSKKGPKRVELAIDARGVQKGLRLEDIASNRVTTLFGLVASREARGYVVDVGVGGATGFLAFKHCDADIKVGAPVECRVLKLDPDSGVCALTTKDVASAKNAPEKTGWSFRALCVGQRVRACVHRRVATGLVVTFADGALAGVIERDHLGRKGSLVDDEAFMNLDEFSVGQFLDARVLLIDRAAKVARLTCAEHLLDLTGAALPAPGAFLKGCSVVPAPRPKPPAQKAKPPVRVPTGGKYAKPRGVVKKKKPNGIPKPRGRAPLGATWDYDKGEWVGGSGKPKPPGAKKPAPKKKDVVPLTTAEKAAVLHAIAQLDGKATQKKVRRAAESILGAPEGSLDAKKAAVKEVCREEVTRMEESANAGDAPAAPSIHPSQAMLGEE